MKLSLIYLFVIGFICSIVFYSCDGPFPTASKPNVPSDHTSSYGGFLHKSVGRNNNIDDCLTCHSLDLAGKVTLINGVSTWANSCYQCHGKLWDRGN